MYARRKRIAGASPPAGAMWFFVAQFTGKAVAACALRGAPLRAYWVHGLFGVACPKPLAIKTTQVLLRALVVTHGGGRFVLVLVVFWGGFGAFPSGACARVCGRASAGEWVQKDFEAEISCRSEGAGVAFDADLSEGAGEDHARGGAASAGGRPFPAPRVRLSGRN